MKSNLHKNPVVLLVSVALAITILFSGFIVLVVALKDDDSGSRDGANYEVFGSCAEIANYVNLQQELSGNYPIFDGFLNEAREDTAEFAEPPSPATAQGESGTTGGTGADGDFSKTNIQVEGVDEADVVKTDGNYLYLVSNYTLIIYDTSDPTKPVQVSETSLKQDGFEMFVDGDKLVIFGRQYRQYGYGIFDTSSKLAADTTTIYVYNIADKANPELKEELNFQGNYVTSRKIDNNVYLVASNYFYPYEELTGSNIEDYIPQVGTEDNFAKAAECDQISRYGDSVSSFITVAAFDLDSSEYNTKVILGDSSNIYMSQNNIYLATAVYEYQESGEPENPFLLNNTIAPDYREPSSTNTEIFKLNVDKNNIEYKAVGEVPGTLLNQFSLDEYYGTLRVATTQNDFGGWSTDSSNGLYVLNEDLEIQGKVEDLGISEQIYSARFAGERAYMVTFRQTDPLYVINLSNPDNPTVEGELKIPGFSNYLHPYDSNHIIGVGQDADPVNGRAEGLKVAMFDVSDVNNPVVKSEVIFEEGSYSDVFYDHKSFLFDKEKELLVIPMVEYHNSFVLEEAVPLTTTPTEDYYDGFVVFDINLTDGIKERGRINMFDLDYLTRSYRAFYLPARSLYIENSLYLIKNELVKVVNLDTLEESFEEEL